MELRYLLIDSLPETVEEELRRSAESADLPVNRAVSAVLRGGELDAAIFAGQRRAPEISHRKTSDLGVHVPEEDHAAIKAAAAGLGVKIGAAARHVLVSKMGKIPEAIQRGLGVKMAAG